MPTFTFTLENGEEVAVKISAYKRDMVKDLEKIVKKNATRVTKEAKDRVPIGPTRNLKNSIRSKDVSKKIGISDSLAKTVTGRKPRGAHRHLVELGARSRYTRSGAYRGMMPTQPYMAPAEKAVAPSFNAEIRNRILKKVEI